MFTYVNQEFLSALPSTTTDLVKFTVVFWFRKQAKIWQSQHPKIISHFKSDPEVMIPPLNKVVFKSEIHLIDHYVDCKRDSNKSAFTWFGWTGVDLVHRVLYKSLFSLKNESRSSSGFEGAFWGGLDILFM